jgi:protein involved in temperature-dependent protein secretion
MELELAKKELQKRMSRKKEFKQKQEELTASGMRKWLIKHGKRDLLDF